MTTTLTHTLTWMDAVAAERASQAEALPTVEALAQAIETFHQTNGLAITPIEALGAATRCLADPDRPVPPIEVPWDRPASVAQWHEQQATAATAYAHWNRWEDRLFHGSLLGFALSGFLGGMVINALGHGWNWITPVFGVLGVLPGLIVGFFIGSCLPDPARNKRIRAAMEEEKLSPMEPTDQDLADLDHWLKIPRLATWLARLRQGEVPLLQGDLEGLRTHAQEDIETLALQDKRDQFTTRLDQGLVDLRAKGELPA